MKKKIAQTLRVVFGAIVLLISLTASVHAQDFTGEWSVIMDSGATLLYTLQQSGPEVSGKYERVWDEPWGYGPSNGSALVKVSAVPAEPARQAPGGIAGTANGSVLRFTWGQDDRRGAGRVTLSSDGESFEGTFSWGDNPDNTSGGSLKGRRRHSFAGVWQGKLGGGGLQLILQQTGGQVTGQVRVNSADLGIIKDGKVVGNRFRFKIVRPGKMSSNGVSSPDEYVGVGELGMNAGGKSFSGNIMGGSAYGTFIGR